MKLKSTCHFLIDVFRSILIRFEQTWSQNLGQSVLIESIKILMIEQEPFLL